MFTGIIQGTGLVTGVIDKGQDMTLTLEAPLLSKMEVGGSIAVNGVCLTAVSVDGAMVEVNAIAETLDRTNLGDLSEGEIVNLELPMTASSMLDGHLVQGHIDGTGTIRRIEDEGESIRVRIEVGEPVLRYLVEKGSVSVDGISLTVASLDSTSFEVAIIPHTRRVTNLGRRQAGDKVNIEVDVVAKYVERLMGK